MRRSGRGSGWRALLVLLALLAAAPPPAAGKTVEDEYQEKVAKLKADSPADQLRLARWCESKGLDDRARLHYGKVIELEPDHAAARRALGYVKHKGSWLLPIEKARAEYAEKVAALVEPDAEARYRLGIWCRNEGLFEEAAREFGEALRLDPGHAGAKKELAAAAGSVLEEKVAAFLDATDPAERARLLAAIREKDRIPEEDVKKWIWFVQGRLRNRPKHDGSEVTKLAHPDFPVRYRLVGNTKGKDLSLLVMLHSGGPSTQVNDQTWEQQLAYRSAPFDLIAMPRVWDDSTGAGWVRESGPVAVDAMIGEILRTYPVDRDRVYLWGYSMGGYGTCWIGCVSPDRFAAGAILAAGHSLGGARTANLLHLPLTIRIGAEDHASDHVGTARQLRDELEANRKLLPDGYAFQYLEYPGVGHQLPPEARTESFAWLTPHRRDPLPRTVVWEPFSPERYPTHKRLYYWLHLEEPRDGMRIEARIEAENRITVKTRNVPRFSILLNGTLVDTSKPVTVEVDGQVAFRGAPAPSLSAIVTSLDAKEDPAQTFDRRIDVSR